MNFPNEGSRHSSTEASSENKEKFEQQEFCTISSEDSFNMFMSTLWQEYMGPELFTINSKVSKESPMVTKAFQFDQLLAGRDYALKNAEHADVWIGCGLLGEKPAPGKRGSAADVVVIPGLYADLDVVDLSLSPRTNLPNTKQEGLSFLSTLPILPNLIVDSGGGLQAWWPFDKPLRTDTPETNAYAAKLVKGWIAYLNRCAEQKGWKFDSVGDLARVMRLPGTSNWKTGTPRPVLIVEEVSDVK